MKTTPYKSLAAALEAFKPEGPEFGDPRRKPTDLEAFRRDLQQVSASNRAYFIICVALLLILFVGAGWLVLRSVDKPNQIAAVFGVTGISFMGIFSQSVRLWKEKVNSDLLIVLAGNLRPQDVKGIVDLLLRKYLK
jgi:hypothetical protein